MRVLGIDMGTHRMGIAVSDESQTIAQPLTSLEANPKSAFLEALKELCIEHEISEIVIGLPLSISGQGGGESALRAKDLGQQIEREISLRVAYFDERFTTAQAERVLVEAGVRRKARRKSVDKIAACLILQGYLDLKASQNQQKTNES